MTTCQYDYLDNCTIDPVCEVHTLKGDGGVFYRCENHSKDIDQIDQVRVIWLR